MYVGDIDKNDLIKLLKTLIEDRPKRKNSAEGKIILHFNNAGMLKKIEEVNFWSSYDCN